MKRKGNQVVAEMEFIMSLLSSKGEFNFLLIPLFL